MNARFAILVESLEPPFQALLGMLPVKASSLPRRMPDRGVYLFSDGSEHLYVGRTNNLRRRIRNHCGDACDHRKAALAFNMARRATGRTKASYKKEGSRAALAIDELFAPQFAEAKRKVATLDVRFVGEVDPTRQALLEIYAATVLATPYNDFENH
jgi:hypothetical protein